jgi:hypothetical protein
MKRGWFLAALGSAAVAPALPDVTPFVAKGAAPLAVSVEVPVTPAFLADAQALYDAACSWKGVRPTMMVVSKVDYARYQALLSYFEESSNLEYPAMIRMPLRQGSYPK